MSLFESNNTGLKGLYIWKYIGNCPVVEGKVEEKFKGNVEVQNHVAPMDNLH